ncbi:hypothetical protein S245_041364, partial [Arachis hypogaea]
TFSLAEFTAAKTDYQDPIVLPTGPRQRTAEELDRDRNRLGSGFRNYGDDRANRSFGDGDDSSNSRWGSSRVSDKPRQNGGFRDSNRELAPSRADEIDNWAAAKKSTVGNGFKRRERDRDIERSGFFDSQLRADESDSWVTNKSYVSSESRRFGSNGGFGGLGFERERKVGFGSSGGEDSDNWNKKKVEFNGESERSEGGGGRPRLVLQPRTTPVNNESQEESDTLLPPLQNPDDKIESKNPHPIPNPIIINKKEGEVSEVVSQLSEEPCSISGSFSTATTVTEKREKEVTSKRSIREGTTTMMKNHKWNSNRSPSMKRPHACDGNVASGRERSVEEEGTRDFIFNYGGLFVALVFVTNWDCNNVSLIFSRSPRRFIFSGFKTFQDKLDESAHKVLTDYQAATVTLLALLSAAPGDMPGLELGLSQNRHIGVINPQ